MDIRQLSFLNIFYCLLRFYVLIITVAKILVYYNYLGLSFNLREIISVGATFLRPDKVLFKKAWGILRSLMWSHMGLKWSISLFN